MGSVLIISVIILGLLGILFGIGLYIASKKLAVEVDPRVEKITDLLPGANCGGCGNPGCAGFAEKLAQGEAEVDECPVCGAEAKKLICDVLGMEMKESEPNIAVIHCQKETSPPRFEYDGDKTCAAANIVNGGFTTCNFACLGFGDWR
ncbi:MAG: RnfABCDGE type electron transport complex subunit B [Planctomycetota bacterium]|nr:RnfABCDGE type electron transport complex subunit B [Planctomycetota bacterium]